jgi:hypothetical protein
VAAVELQVRFVEEPYPDARRALPRLRLAGWEVRARYREDEVMTDATLARQEKLHRRGIRLEVFTITWNVVEALVAVGAHAQVDGDRSQASHKLSDKRSIGYERGLRVSKLDSLTPA